MQGRRAEGGSLSLFFQIERGSSGVDDGRNAALNKTRDLAIITPESQSELNLAAWE